MEHRRRGSKVARLKKSALLIFGIKGSLNSHLEILSQAEPDSSPVACSELLTVSKAALKCRRVIGTERSLTAWKAGFRIASQEVMLTTVRSAFSGAESAE